jgi:hypothetical protein
VDKYAVRFLEESGPPFDVAAAAAAAAAGGDGRADWDVEQIQALQEQVRNLRLQGMGTAPAAAVLPALGIPWHTPRAGQQLMGTRTSMHDRSPGV